MIIKKKRNQDSQNIPEQPQSKQDTTEESADDEIFSKINIDNINFDQRAERRQGSRRRGYRRIDDRNLVSRAQEEAISIKEMAAKEGHKIGIEAAKGDIENLRAAIDEFFSYKHKVYEELSSGVLDVSLEIAKKILNSELETNNEALLNIINEVLNNHAKGENRITIKVMPNNVEFVREHVPDILSNTQFEAKIVVVSDDSIKLGGVIVETSNGVVDASIETQLSVIQEAFKKI